MVVEEPVAASRGDDGTVGVDFRGGGGQYRVRGAAEGPGASLWVVASRHGGEVIGRAVLSVSGVVRVVAPLRLALAPVAEGQGNLLVDPGYGDETTTGELAREVTERFLQEVQLFAARILKNRGIWNVVGHEGPWIIAV
jgi:hypothetical protein